MENGLEDECFIVEYSRATEVLNKIKSELTKIQISELKLLMKYKQDGIVDPNGKYYKY